LTGVADGRLSKEQITMDRSIASAGTSVLKKQRAGWLVLCLLAAIAIAAFPAAAQEGATCGIVVTPDGTTQNWGPCPNQNTQQQPSTPSLWGAIAWSRSTAGWGVSWKFSTQQAAKDYAMGGCAKSGAKDCAVNTLIADNLCTALAISLPEKVFGIGLSGVTDLASDTATYRCKAAGGKSCKIARSFCADGVTRVMPKPTGGVFF
jgi:hypothetical protein